MEKHHHDHDDEHLHTCDCGHDHDHDEDCDCGCDSDMIYLTLDDDTELECQVLGVFEVEEREYIALLPLEEGEEDGAVLIYRYAEDENGEPELTMIETDEEFERVGNTFDQLWGEDEE